MLTPYLPHRRVGHGGGTAVRDLVTWLAKKHDVMVVSLIRPGEADLLADVGALGVQVRGLPFLDGTAPGPARLKLLGRRLAAAARSLFSGHPYYVEKYADGKLAAQVRLAVNEFQPDAVQIEYLQLASYCRDLRRMRDGAGRTTPRLILNSHELGSVPRERRARRATHPLAAWRARSEAAAWRRLQVAASAWADTTLCVTPEDHERYLAMGGRNLLTVPLGMDLTTLSADWQPDLEHETHLFVGSFGHRPNVLAAEFLLDHVWPRVSAARPGADLVLVGRGSASFLSARLAPEHWPSQRVKAMGFVDDLDDLFRRCRLFVAPLPEGGGIKIKILEAMARGVPVVTTPVGAEGIAGPDSGALTIAACDETFATAVLRDADDLSGCEQRVRVARRLMVANFGWEAITDRLVEIYASPGPD